MSEDLLTLAGDCCWLSLRALDTLFMVHFHSEEQIRTLRCMSTRLGRWSRPFGACDPLSYTSATLRPLPAILSESVVKPYTRPVANGRNSSSCGPGRDSLTMRRRGINAASLRHMRQIRSLGSLGRSNLDPAYTARSSNWPCSLSHSLGLSIFVIWAFTIFQNRGVWFASIR